MHYINLENVDSFMKGNPNERKWSRLTSEQKTYYINFAESKVDEFDKRFLGKRLNPRSTHAFPRDFSERIVDENDLYNPLLLNNERIPPEVYDTVYSIIASLVSSIAFKQLQDMKANLGATNVKVGSIGVTMQDVDDNINTIIRDRLADYLILNYSFRRQ